MTVKSKADLLSDLASNLADNDTGDITPAVMRTMLTDIIDSLALYESTSTFGPGDAYAKDGSTFPALGVSGGAFLGFDAAATETAMFSIGKLIPDDWRTVAFYLETFNFTGDPGVNDKVLWEVAKGGGTSTTLQTVTADLQQTVFRVGNASYTLDSNDVNGTDKYGAVIGLSRLGGDGTDTFTSDIPLSSLHVVRLT